MEIQGTIKKIGETQTVGSAGTFRKREVVVTTEEQYPQHILVEFVQDKCNLLDNFNVHDQVTISINIRGREWTNPQGELKYFNSIQGWRIEKVSSNNNISDVPPPPNFETMPNDEKGISDESDDLPF